MPLIRFAARVCFCGGRTIAVHLAVMCIAAVTTVLFRAIAWDWDTAAAGRCAWLSTAHTARFHVGAKIFSTLCVVEPHNSKQTSPPSPRYSRTHNIRTHNTRYRMRPCCSSCCRICCNALRCGSASVEHSA